MTYYFHIHYADGLTKKGEIKDTQVEENMTTWIHEMDNQDGDELVYLKIRKQKVGTV